MLLPYRWAQGEHMAILGDTGSGKSTLAAALLTARRYRIIFRSKSDDVTYEGARRITRARDLSDPRFDAFELAPAYRSQAVEFAGALDLAYQAGGWATYLDELWYLDRLGLRSRIDRLYTQGRSLGVTVIAGMQRPVEVTRFAISQSTHVLIFATEGRDVRTVLDATTPRLKAPLAGLTRYELLWFNRRERNWWVGSLADLSEDGDGFL